MKDQPKEILGKYAIGEIITLKSLLDKNSEKLLKKYKNKETVKVMLSSIISQAKKLEIIERCDNSSVPQSFKEIESVSYWQSQLRGNRSKHITTKSSKSTKKAYLQQLWNFNVWLQEKTFEITVLQSGKENTFVQKKIKKNFSNVSELLELLEQPILNDKNVTRIIKQYLLDEIHATKKASTMIVTKNAIISYFEKNEQPIKVLFNPKTIYNTDEQEQSISLSEFMEFLTTGKPSITQKTVFLCKFHRGLDISTLADRFNFEAWKQITKWFGSENHNSWDLEKCPVPITLTRIKTDFKHTGFIDRDAVEQLQKYLDFRESKTKSPMKNGMALFINKFGKPITIEWLMRSFAIIAKRAGIQKYVTVNGRKEYKMDSHELRDLLKSTLIDVGCRSDVADHVIGHKPKDSYEKQSKLYPETMRLEYAKASKRINIFTKMSSILDGSEDPDSIRIQLQEQKIEMQKIKERQKADVATKMQDDFLTRNLQQQIDSIRNGKEAENEELKLKVTQLEKELQKHREKPNEPKKIMRFGCKDCRLEHNKSKCPICGSDIRGILEEAEIAN